MGPIIVIVAKAPVPSRVKTRLCPQLTATEAARLYTLFFQDMVEEMLRLTRSSGALPACGTVAVAYTPDGAEEDFKAILPQAVPLFPQQGRDLGQRLAGIFEKLYGQGYAPVIVINSDSPDMPHALVGRSIERLAEPHIDLVLGPCRDGGYYLIGSKRPLAQLFSDIPWSTDRVLDTTVQCARELGLRFTLLDPWYDIDHYEDLLLFLERNRNRPDASREAGWRTLRYLRGRRTDNQWPIHNPCTRLHTCPRATTNKGQRP